MIQASGGGSATCSAPTLTVFDGYVASAYTRLRVQQAGSQEADVCFRAQSGSAPGIGGSFHVDGGFVSLLPPSVTPPSGPPAVTPPTVDASAGQCSATPGNTVPGPRPLLSGALGDPSDAFYTTYQADAYSGSSGTWVCASVGPLAQRVVFPGADAPLPGITPPSGPPDAGAPSIAFTQDPAPGPAAPAAPPWPGGNPSSVCRAGAGGTYAEVVNADVGGSHVWLGARQISSTRVQLCTRIDGGLDRGGALTIDAGAAGVDPTGSPGVTLVVTPSAEQSSCSHAVLTNDSPVRLHVRRSADGANPAALCVDVNGSLLGVTAGATGSPKAPDVNATPPSVTWSPDPGTPG